MFATTARLTIASVMAAIAIASAAAMQPARTVVHVQGVGAQAAQVAVGMPS